MGPLTLADYVGLDTMLFILEGWVKRYPNEPAFFVPESLREKVGRDGGPSLPPFEQVMMWLVCGGR
jgi:3-hydroxyacyl-CoA dehydrogenase